jgi:CRISPR-associated protein Cas1
LTLKGKTSHYDIKILSGYGYSISVRNQRIVLKNGADVFTGRSETEEHIPTALPYSRLVLVGKNGYVSAKAIHLLSENHISLIFLDTFGNLKASIQEDMSSFTGVHRRMGQYDTFRNSAKCLILQKNLVVAKLQSEIDFVSDGLVKRKLGKFQELVRKASSYKMILSFEAKAGIIWRNHYASLFDEKYEYDSRKNAGRCAQHNSKRQGLYARYGANKVACARVV